MHPTTTDRAGCVAVRIQAFSPQTVHRDSWCDYRILLSDPHEPTVETVRRIIKRIVAVFLTFLSVAACWFAWQLWMCYGYFACVHWITKDGGLEMNYQAGKPHLALLQVNASYVPGVERVWIKDMPGATERWIGRAEVPPPEELFRRAQIHINRDSDLLAVCRYFPSATEDQRTTILDHVEWLAKDGKLPGEVRECFDKARYEEKKE